MPSVGLGGLRIPSAFFASSAGKPFAFALAFGVAFWAPVLANYPAAAG